MGTEGHATRYSRVCEGDFLMVEGTDRDTEQDYADGYFVRKIVPIDEEAGVVGWLELDRRPVEAEELKQRADRVVRPAAP